MQVLTTTPFPHRYATRALWHMASQEENRTLIANAGAIKPLIGMLAAEGDVAAELAAIILVRLARGNTEVSIQIAAQGGVLPLVRLVESGSAGSQQQAASCLSELALVPKNRNIVANAHGIQPIIALLCSPTSGTPETAARVLARLSHEDPSVVDVEAKARLLMLTRLRPKLEPLLTKAGMQWDVAEAKLVAAESIDGLMENPVEFITALGDGAEAKARAAKDGEIKGAAERRAQIHMMGGIKRLISMLDGSNLTGGVKVKGWVPPTTQARKDLATGDAKEKGAPSTKGKDMKDAEAGPKVGMPRSRSPTLRTITPTCRMRSSKRAPCLRCWPSSG